MKVYLRAISDFAWECLFAIAALRWRHVAPPPAKPYSQADAITTSITNLKGARK